jgi:hypothetical protein
MLTKHRRHSVALEDQESKTDKAGGSRQETYICEELRNVACSSGEMEGISFGKRQVMWR